jgi:hypothetical protein
MATQSQQPSRSAPAVHAPRPKILRIGVILGDKIVEERLIRDRGPVSIGQSARNTFCVPAPELPRAWTLFQMVRGNYILNLSDAMDGRLSDGGAVVPLAQLKAAGKAQKQGNAWLLPIGDNARGRIVIGDMTLLFQFVIPPPVQPKPQLPHSVRGSLADRIDPYLAVILSVSMVAHLLVWGYFKFVAEDEKTPTPDAIPDQFASVVLQRPKPPPPPKEQTPAEPAKTTEEPEKPTRKSEEKVVPKEPDKEEIARRVEAAAPLRVLRHLAAKGNGPLGLGTGDKESWEDLDKGLKNVGGGNVVASVGTAGQETRGTGGAAEMATGKEVGVTGPSGPKATGKEKVEQEIKITGRAEKIEDIESGGLNPDNVASTIRQRYQVRVNACYQRALKNNPNLGGKVSLRFSVGIAGSVVKAHAEGFDSEVDQCIEREARLWRFEKPESVAEFEIPFILRRVN